MRGLIYKDICLFFKSLDKRMMPIGIVALVILVSKQGVYTGMLFSVMLAMVVGIQNVLIFEKEEKVEWKKYQRTLPVSCGKTVAVKYGAVLVTAVVSMMLSVVCNLAVFAAYRTFSLMLLGLSMLFSMVIPVAWAVVTLPFCYWFDYQISQYASIVLIFPLFFFIKNFEDGLWEVSDLLALCGAYLASLAVSAAGYCRRK